MSLREKTNMKTLQMTLDEELIEMVDKAVKRLGTTRSAFTREALRKAVEKLEIEEMERKHRHGYKKLPVRQDEFSEWEAEQVWAD